MSKKLQNLLEEWPQGTVAINSWLQSMGISNQLKQRYLHSGWIRSLGHGVSKRRHDKVGWEGALFALQNQNTLPIHLGGKSSLEIQGSSHFIKIRQSKIELFGPLGIKMPAWFSSNDWGVTTSYYTTNFLGDIGISEFSFGNFSIKISEMERAILEMIYLLNKEHTFEEIVYIFENLAFLRPNLLQEMLECCKSMKVKGIFIALATKFEHRWFNDLKLEKIDLGSTPVHFSSNGTIAKYGIKLPQEFTNETIFS